MKTILRPSGEDSFLQDAIRDFVVVVVDELTAEIGAEKTE